MVAIFLDFGDGRGHNVAFEVFGLISWDENTVGLECEAAAITSSLSEDVSMNGEQW